MRPRATDNMTTRRRRRRRGFSLAELMIALALLALGLLVIGAALPVGIQYTRQSIDMATGQAAAQQALNLIEQNLSLRKTILDGSGTLIREPGLFRPRNPDGTLARENPADPNSRLWEPLIKVRPLFTYRIDARPGSQSYGQQKVVPEVRVEDRIREWLNASFSGVAGDTRECDPLGPNHWLRPALPSVALVYPPISADLPYWPGNYVALGSEPNKYGIKPVSAAEALKALERRVMWTAFYRRVSYAKDSDPGLYEFIMVAVHRPSPNHRFPVQEAAGGEAAFAHGRYGKANMDSAAPIPWLVSFRPGDTLPRPLNGFDPQGFPSMGPQGEPATLQFLLDPNPATLPVDDGLFPVGTMFIPARNDDDPSAFTGQEVELVWFGPATQSTLPIYEVVERPDQETVIVRYNGYYPRKGTRTPLAGEWPVWVIPPAFEEVDASGKPVFGKRSPILAVARRYIRLREIP